MPLRLKKSKLTVKVIIPDQEIEEYQQPVEERKGIRAELDNILGKYRGGREQFTPTMMTLLINSNRSVSMVKAKKNMTIFVSLSTLGSIPCKLRYAIIANRTNEYS